MEVLHCIYVELLHLSHDLYLRNPGKLDFTPDSLTGVYESN